MSIPTVHHTPLRHRAESRPKDGTAPPTTKAWATGIDALSQLHRLASATASAGDALKLLHELQVHHVELDLQQEHIEQTQTELSESLARYVEWFDCAPAAYFCVDRDGKIIEANLAGAELFAMERAELNGRRIDQLVAAKSRLLLLGVLKRLRGGSAKETCEVQCGKRALQVVANAAPGGQTFLLVFSESAGGAV